MRALQHPWGWTSTAPILCAVHCATAPVVALFAPVVARSAAIEWSLLAGTLVIATVAAVAGLRAHGDPRPVYTIGLGLAVWTLSLLYVFQPIPEDVTTTIAALTTATGLLWNSRLHCAGTVECAACEDVEDDAPAVAAAKSTAAKGPASG